MAQKLDDKIEDMQEKLKQLKALKQKQEARAKAEKSKAERKADARRKILLGAWVIDAMKKGEMKEPVVKGYLNKFLVKDTERALFGLPPLPKP